VEISWRLKGRKKQKKKTHRLSTEIKINHIWNGIWLIKDYDWLLQVQALKKALTTFQDYYKKLQITSKPAINEVHINQKQGCEKCSLFKFKCALFSAFSFWYYYFSCQIKAFEKKYKTLKQELLNTKEKSRQSLQELSNRKEKEILILKRQFQAKLDEVTFF
jgi:hypothetical protein